MVKKSRHLSLFSADTPWDRTYPVTAILFYNGTVFWMPPSYVKSSCKVDVTYFPFDDQTCKFKVLKNLIGFLPKIVKIKFEI